MTATGVWAPTTVEKIDRKKKTALGFSALARKPRLMADHGSSAPLPSAAGGLVPDAIARLLARRPGLRVTVTEGQHERLTLMLRRGDLDLVVGRLPPRRRLADIAETILATDRGRLVVRTGHALAQLAASDAGLSLGALQRQQWILPPTETTMRRQLDAMFDTAGLAAPVPRVESLSFLSNRRAPLAACVEGIGAARAPR